MAYDLATGLSWLLEPSYQVYARLEVYDGEGRWHNLGSYGGDNWFRGAEWGADIDRPVAELTADVALKIGERRMSPLITQTLDLGRAVQLKTVLVKPGTPVHAAKGWRRSFVGFIDDYDVSPDGNSIRLRCADRASLLRDTFIKEPDDKKRIFGRKGEGGLPLTSREEVMRDLLAQYGMSQTELLVPTPSESFVLPYLQKRTSLWQALQDHALQLGWDLRYRFFEPEDPDNLGDWQLVFAEPRRYEGGADYRLALKDYLKLSPVRAALADLRNTVEVTYYDSVASEKRTVRRQHIESMQRYNERYMALQEDASSLIDSYEEADRLAAALIADLATPKATTGFSRLFWPYVDLGDTVQLEADYITFDTEPQLSVTSYKHVLRKDQERTEVSLRDDRPAAAHSRWLEREAGVKGVDIPVPVLPGSRPYLKDPPSLVTGTQGFSDEQIAYIDVSWPEDPKGVAEYLNIRYRINSPDETWTMTSASPGQTRFRLTGLQNGMPYAVALQVVSPSGTLGPWSDSRWVIAATDPIPPDRPVGLVFFPSFGAAAHSSRSELHWGQPGERDYAYTELQFRYDAEGWSEYRYYATTATMSPGNALYWEKNAYPLQSDRFWFRIKHIDKAGNESDTVEVGPIQFDGGLGSGALTNLTIYPTSDGDPGGAGGGTGEGDGDAGGGGGGGTSGPGPGAVLIGNAIITAPEVYDASVLSAEAALMIERLHRLYDPAVRPETYIGFRRWNGRTGFDNRGGQYFCSRGLSSMVGTAMPMTFMVTGDLTWLDYMTHAWTKYQGAMEGPGTSIGDREGPEMSSADGYRGITFGLGGVGQIMAGTNKQIPLEDGVTAAGEGALYFFCIKNRDRFSPTFEPPGNRPATPAYYKKVAAEVKDYMRNHRWKKWYDYLSGKFGGGARPSVRDEVLHVKKAFSHAIWSEILESVYIGMADGGADYKNNQDYKDAKRAARVLFFGDEYDGGKRGTVRVVGTSSGDALYWGQYCQMFNTDYKTVSGVRTVVPREVQFTQFGTYLSQTYGSMNMVKLLTGDDLITDAEIEAAAVTAAISVLNPKLTQSGTWSGTMTSNGTVLPDTFGGSQSPYPKNKWTQGQYAILMPYDKSGRIEEITRRWYADLNYGTIHDGPALSVLNQLVVKGEVRL